LQRVVFAAQPEGEGTPGVTRMTPSRTRGHAAIATHAAKQNTSPPKLARP
jgi:hypothetical protein